MASDEDYMAFLDKANRDPNEGVSNTTTAAANAAAAGELKAADEGADVPAPIAQAVRDAFYVSDADEPFVPVCLELPSAGDGGREGLPDEGA